MEMTIPLSSLRDRRCRAHANITYKQQVIITLPNLRSEANEETHLPILSRLQGDDGGASKVRRGSAR